jgi:tetratricopeptide (TPR) repeat protein
MKDLNGRRPHIRAISTIRADTTAHIRALFGLGVAAALGLAIIATSLAAFAAGSGSGTESNASSAVSLSTEMRKAQVLVKKEAFAEALGLLQAEVASNPDNADAWNLIGYSARNLGDYETSQDAYDKALAIEPGHKGALEYKGELYLALGNLEGAEALLAKLRKVCSFNCDEVDDLKDAIAAYKKAQ